MREARPIAEAIGRRVAEPRQWGTNARLAGPVALTVAFALLLPRAGRFAQDAAAVVGRAARVYASRLPRADFTADIDDSLIGEFGQSWSPGSGRPEQLAMRFSDPAGDAIVVDGKYVWVYTPSTAPAR